MPQPKSTSGKRTSSKQGSPAASGGSGKAASRGSRRTASGGAAGAASDVDKRGTTSRSTARSHPGADSDTATEVSSVHEILVRSVLAPVNAVMLTAERIQAAMDEAVERGRMTRDDANDLVLELVKTGRRQTEDLLAELDALLGRGRGSLENAASEAAARARRAPGGERVAREVDRARRAAGIGSPFPILGYDDLTARQVTERLADLTPPELRKVRDHERRHANRKSVLGALEKRLG